MTQDDRMETITDPAEIRATDDPDERGDFPCCTTPAPVGAAVALDLDAGGRFATNAMAQARAAGVLVEHSGAGVSGGTVMRGDAEITRLRRVLVEEITRAEAAEAEVGTLRARLAAVEALVRDWPCSDDTCDGDCTGCAYASDLRAALATTGEGQ